MVKAVFVGNSKTVFTYEGKFFKSGDSQSFPDEESIPDAIRNNSLFTFYGDEGNKLDIYVPARIGFSARIGGKKEKKEKELKKKKETD